MGNWLLYLTPLSFGSKSNQSLGVEAFFSCGGGGTFQLIAFLFSALK